jgi:hypothetical protein
VATGPASGAVDFAEGALRLEGGPDTHGGQVYGFSIVGGACGTGDCPFGAAAILVTDWGADATVVNGPRARVKNMFLEGAGGRVLASSAGFVGATTSSTAVGGADPVADATYANNTITLTISPSTPVVTGRLNSTFAIESATPGFSGLYVASVLPASNSTYTVTVYTNNPAGLANGTKASGVAWASGHFGGLSYGLVVDNSNGTFEDNDAENFAQAGDFYGFGVMVLSTYGTDGAALNGTAVFKGFDLYNNRIGFLANSGFTTIDDSPEGASVAAPFVQHPTIEHSWDTGLLADTSLINGAPQFVTFIWRQAVVTAYHLRIFDTAHTESLGLPELALAPGSGIFVSRTSAVDVYDAQSHDNAYAGATVVGRTFPQGYSLRATGSQFDSNDFYGIDAYNGNTTVIDSEVNDNVVYGIWAHTLNYWVTVNGGTVDGNGLGIRNQLGLGGQSNLLIQPGTANPEVNDNDSIGLLAETGKVVVKSASIDGNGGLVEGCPSNSTNASFHEFGAFINGTAVLSMTGSSVNDNHGGGLLIVNSNDNQIDTSTFNHNGFDKAGAPTAKDLKNCFIDQVHPLELDIYSGIVVAPQMYLALGTGGNHADSNADNGAYIFGELDGGLQSTPGGGALNAQLNNKSGVLVDAAGVVVFQAGAELNGNCVAPGKDANGDDYVAAAIKSFGLLQIDTKAVKIHDNHCDGIYIDSQNASVGNGESSLALVQLHANDKDGMKVVSTRTAGDPDFTSTNGTPEIEASWGLVADRLLVSGNKGKAGVELGGADQTGDLTVLLENSKIGFNVGDGVFASSSENAVNSTGDQQPGEVAFLPGRTDVTLYANRIVQNVGAGLYLQQAFIANGVIAGGEIVGISANVINHNGFSSTADTMCKTGQTVANSVFAGTAPKTINAFDCTTQMDSDACGTHQTDGCIWTGVTSKCQRSYQFNGLTGNTTAANTVSGYTYRFDTSVLPGPETSGMLSTGDNTHGFAYVNATNNSWSVGTPLAQKDYWQDAFTFIVTQTTVSANNTCTIFTDTPPT